MFTRLIKLRPGDLRGTVGLSKQVEFHLQTIEDPVFLQQVEAGLHLFVLGLELVDVAERVFLSALVLQKEVDDQVNHWVDIQYAANVLDEVLELT